MPKLKLLILDNDELTVLTIRNVAEFAGMSVRVATTITDFFNLLTTWHPSHIVLGLIMPGMDGVEILRALSERKVTAQIIITSSIGEQVLQAAARSATAHGLNIAGILPKPFSPKAFRAIIEVPTTTAVTPHEGQQQSEISVPAITAQELVQAIEQREITVAYQPKVDCRSGALVGFEALARWHHAEYGALGPDLFIAVAEKHGHIDTLTLLVIEQAVAWFSQFKQQYPARLQASPLLCAVNISALSLHRLDLFTRIEALCKQYSVMPQEVMLELTETGAMDDPVTSLDILTRLRMKGFQLSIDDFGTGFSSMLQLVRMPFTEVKIDKSFVMTAQQSRESRLVIQAIIDLAHSLDMKVIAEGIEDLATLQFLQQLGCDKAQGYFISKPLSAEQVNDWLEQRKLTLEQQRIQALHSLKIMDSGTEQRFDRITRLAKRLFGVPVALITLLDTDRQWFKSKAGTDISETAREHAFCNYTIEQDAGFVVNDSNNDPRFIDNPLVNDAPHIRFYAGYPFRAPSGERLGAICLIDRQPREMSDSDLLLLRDLAAMVEEEVATNQLLNEDHLTGLLNRRGFETRANQLLQICRTQQYAASLIYFDLDNFKQINDLHGHRAGDNALLQFSKLLASTFRDSDLIGRIGGDEFVVLMITQTETDADAILSRLSKTVMDYNQTISTNTHLRYSFGISTTQSLADYELQFLYTKADEAMYRDKYGEQQHDVASHAPAPP